MNFASIPPFYSACLLLLFVAFVSVFQCFNVLQAQQKRYCAYDAERAVEEAPVGWYLPDYAADKCQRQNCRARTSTRCRTTS